MTTKSNEDRLKQVFSRSLGLTLEEISDSLEYGNTKQWDSTAHMILIGNLETEFDLMLDTLDVLDLSSINKSKEILRKYNVDV